MSIAVAPARTAFAADTAMGSGSPPRICMAIVKASPSRSFNLRRAIQRQPKPIPSGIHAAPIRKITLQY